jgi:hypothetical protein
MSFSLYNLNHIPIRCCRISSVDKALLNYRFVILEGYREKYTGEGVVLWDFSLSMALQPFVRPWPLFQFHNAIHSR